MKIALVLGTRPEIIKLSPVIRVLERRGIDFFIIHTNQHYSNNMDKIFFKELSIKKPKYNLNVNSLTHGHMLGNMMIKIEKVLLKEKPDWVLVQGDTNSVMAGAIIGQRLGIKVGHIEAGLRSYDTTMPEEINRVITDHVSDLLFCPTENQVKKLIKEGIEKRKIIVTGNTIVEAVFQNLKLGKKLEYFKKDKIGKYLLLTLHRPSNVDNKNILNEIINSIEVAARKFNIRIIFPVHPRTMKQLKKFRISVNRKRILLIKPVGYLEMLILEKYSKLILTDSGGIQEEACILRVPCVTIRDNTERPETVEVGANILVGNKKEKLIEGIEKMLSSDKNWGNPYGSGKISEKIINNLY